MSRFDAHTFASAFASHLASKNLNGSQFAKISEIPQYKVSRILSVKVKFFGSDHAKICKFMRISAAKFYSSPKEDLAAAIERSCSVEAKQAKWLAKVVSAISEISEIEESVSRKELG